MNNISKKSFKIKILPSGKSVEIEQGKTILDALRRADIGIQASCGGEGTCGDCIVQVISGEYKGKISAASEKNQKGYVLACSTEIIDDIVIYSAPLDTLLIKNKIDIFEIDKEKISGSNEIEPFIKTYEIFVPEPTLQDNYSDLKRIRRELLKVSGKDFSDCEYQVVKKLAAVLRESNNHILVVTLDNPEIIIDIRPAPGEKGLYGAAIDIGTTTVALCIVNLLTGKILFTKTILNLQRACGEEIISRINYSSKPGGLQEMNDLVLKTIHNLLDEALLELGIGREEIYFASISGNTTMIHLFLNINPVYIREEPYVPTVNNIPIFKAKELGLKINDEGRVYCAPSVGSYVGGDITAGLISAPLLKCINKVNLFIDIGTNGELVIGNKEWMVTCACSAGPAFEGSGITCGMPASNGAIEKIRIESGNIKYKIIGGGKPKGICGSGIVDLLAELFTNGVIDRNGRFDFNSDTNRLQKNNNINSFIVVEGKDSFDGNDIVITENDVVNLIRTKGAIFSSCALLLKYVGLTFDGIDAIYIAGGFGKYLDIENSIRIGLFPDIERNKFNYLGNTSLIGTYLCLINNSNRKFVQEVSEKMTYMELNTEPGYMNEYTGALFLPHTDMNLFPSMKAFTKNGFLNQIIQG